MVITNLGESYKEVLFDIYKIIRDGNYDEILDFVGEGFSSRVYSYDDFAIKIFNKNKDSYMFRDEDYKYLEILKESSYFPNLYAYKESEFMIVDYIEGYMIEELDLAIKNNYFSEDVLNDLEKKVSKQLWNMVDVCKKYNIIPYDIHPKNIIINNNADMFVVDVGYFKSFSRDINTHNYLSKSEIEDMYDNSYEDIFETDSELFHMLTRLIN